MPKHVLFIQGGGEGAYAEDKLLADSLQKALGTEYAVHYPAMPNEDDPQDDVWGAQIARELDTLDGSVILVGHSAGASVLLDYLSKAMVEKPIAGIFLIAPAYWDEYVPRLPNVPAYFYHSRDDKIIPFSHVRMFADRLPQATIREFDGRGHQFNNDLSDVADDIKSLSNR